MKQLIIICIAACMFAACKQPATKTATDNKIVIGVIDSLNSSILKETRKVWVYVPDSYKNSPGSKQRYPVVYLLDGDAHFSSVVGMIQQLSSVNGNTICPEMIVVGIPNTNRTRDLTPTHVDVDDPYLDSASAKPSGGGEAFTGFIEKELMPHIDSLYPTNTYKVLIGHSFGGLMVINTLMHHPQLFNAYVAIDPSMWWDRKKLLAEVGKGLPARLFENRAVFMGIANTMKAGEDTLHIQKDTTADSKHIRSILALSHYLSADKGAGLRFAYKYYNTDNHSSVPLITAYDALHFLFDYYRLDISDEEYSNITQQVIDKIKSHYDTISLRMGVKMLPPELLVNQLAYQASSTKHNTEAITLALLNTANYPESANTFDSLGDIYSAAGDKAKAAESYKKALLINKDMAETQKKLDKLEGK